jgi:hypothetical protein
VDAPRGVGKLRRRLTVISLHAALRALDNGDRRGYAALIRVEADGTVTVVVIGS